MPVIGQQAFVLAPTPNKYLSLTNEEFVRKLDLSKYGNNWSKIRLSLNCAFANTGGGNLSNFTLWIGLCSGTTYPAGSQQCVNFAGYYWGDALTGTQAATYNAGAGNPYYSGGLSYYGLRKVGANWVSSTIGSTTWAFVATGGTLERRGWLCAEIQQSATQVFPTVKTEAVATAATDVWYEHFVYASNQGGQPYVQETVVGSLTQTLTPGAGWNTNALDTVDILWASPTYEMRIYAMYVNIIP